MRYINFNLYKDVIKNNYVVIEVKLKEELENSIKKINNLFD